VKLCTHSRPLYGVRQRTSERGFSFGNARAIRTELGLVRFVLICQRLLLCEGIVFRVQTCTTRVDCGYPVGRFQFSCCALNTSDRAGLVSRLSRLLPVSGIPCLLTTLTNFGLRRSSIVGRNLYRLTGQLLQIGPTTSRSVVLRTTAVACGR